MDLADRTNIGNARLAGLEADLGMSGLDYNASDFDITSARQISLTLEAGRTCNFLSLLRPC